MAAETGVERERIRLYHMHALKCANVAFLDPLSTMLFRLQRLKRNEVYVCFRSIYINRGLIVTQS